MPKPITEAKLSLNSITGRQVNVSTSGTRPAAGVRLSNWVMDWADTSRENGSGYPPIDLQHDYIKDGDYNTTLSITDSKNKSSKANLMLIVRNPVVTAPSAPSGLNSVLINNGQIDLSWTDNANNETGFELQCQIDGGSFFNRTQLPANTVLYSDNQVTANHTYTYRVRAFNAGGFSSFSNTTSQTTGVTVYDYIVSPTGQDSPNITGSLAQPFKTLNYAVTFLSPGKTLGVRTGTPYNESLTSNIPSGTSFLTTGQVRIVEYNNETVIMRPTSLGDSSIIQFDNAQKFIEIDGINLDGSLLTSLSFMCCARVYTSVGTGQLAHDIKIKNCEMTRATGVPGQIVLADCHQIGMLQNVWLINVVGHGPGFDNFDNGFYLQGTGNLVEGCDVSIVKGAGIQIYAADHNDVQAIVRDNKVHDLSGSQAQADGIVIGRGTLSEVYNNLVYNLTATTSTFGIYWFSSATNGKCYFNTVYNSQNFGFIIDAGLNIDFQNNLAYLNGDNSATANFSDAGIGTRSHNFTSGANPLFVNPGVDFHLQVGSPCKGAGVTIAAVPTDIDGNLRANPPSIGCYE